MSQNQGMASMRDIKSYCDQIAAVFRPQKIILFGSHAYGKPNRDSDVDVLVVMPKSRIMGNRPSLKIRRAVRAGFPVDILVRDPHFMATRLKEGDSFLEEITEKGRLMYEGCHA